MEAEETRASWEHIPGAGSRCGRVLFRQSPQSEGDLSFESNQLLDVKISVNSMHELAQKSS